MKISMVVLDLDSTLLHNDKSLSLYSESVLSRYSEIGKVVIATGRALIRSQKYMDRIHASGLIAMSGALVYDNGQCIKEESIQEDTVRNLVKTLLSFKNTNVTVNYPDHACLSNPEFVTEDRPLLNPDTFDTAGIQKLSIFSEDRDSVLALNPADYGCKLIQNAADPNYFVMVSHTINKLLGIHTLCERWNIPLQEVAAFGDDYNDIEMLQGAGLGLAVTNAEPAVKDAADILIDSNEADGPAKWIEENCLD